MVLSMVSPCFLPIPSFWHKFRMSDVWLDPDKPSAIRICSNRHNSIQQLGMTFTVTPKPKSVRLSHGILTRKGLFPSSPMHDVSPPQENRLRELHLTPIVTSVEQCWIHNSNFVATSSKCRLPISHPVCTCCTRSVHRSLMHLHLLAVWLPVEIRCMLHDPLAP